MEYILASFQNSECMESTFFFFEDRGSLAEYLKETVKQEKLDRGEDGMTYATPEEIDDFAMCIAGISDYLCLYGDGNYEFGVTACNTVDIKVIR